MSPRAAHLPNVLIVVPGGKEPQHALRAAIDLAKKRGGILIALVVLNPDLPTRVASTLTEVGFMGEEVGSQVSDTLSHEYRARAQSLLQALVDQAGREAVTVTPLIEEGEPSEICNRVIREHRIGTTILVAEKQSWLTRFLSRSAAVRLPAVPGCEVLVMEED